MLLLNIFGKEVKIMKTLKLKIENYIDSYGEIYGQELWSEDENIHYMVNDLCECPEDATINRALVSAYEIADFIELGIELAKKGYDKISIERIIVNPDENE